jgi:hypothetical protein
MDSVPGIRIEGAAGGCGEGMGVGGCGEGMGVVGVVKGWV